MQFPATPLRRVTREHPQVALGIVLAVLLGALIALPFVA